MASGRFEQSAGNPASSSTCVEASDACGAVEATITDIVFAGRILSWHGVLDSFGHVSARHPADPRRYLMPQVKAAELVLDGDIITFGLDDKPQPSTKARVFAERCIHSAIYRARPDVMAVCHHHSPSMLAFCTSTAVLVPVFHLGATMGSKAPLWDSQDDFGDTNLIVSTKEQGDSLARALGPYWTVLMRGHGVTTAGQSVREVVFRAIYGSKNAEVQLRATLLGGVKPLSSAEAESASEFNLQPFAMDRAWEQWCRQVETRSG